MLLQRQVTVLGLIVGEVQREQPGTLGKVLLAGVLNGGFEGWTIQEKTTFSPSLAFTAPLKSVTSPWGRSLPRDSTTCCAPC